MGHFRDMPLRDRNALRDDLTRPYRAYAIKRSGVGGRDFKAVLEALTESEIPMPCSGRWAKAGMVRSGGTDLAWCVYDAQYFGTAQRRRRVFLVADFRGTRAGEILFVPKSLYGYFAAGGTPRQGITAYAQDSIGGTGERTDGYGLSKS